MVEVATKEEFDEFKKQIEDRLDKMEENTRKSMDARMKLFAAINKRMDEVEEKSKSVYTRIREVLEPVPE